MPTVTIGDNTGNDYSGTEDNYILESGVHINNGRGTSIPIEDPADGYEDITLIKFSGLSSITGPVTVSDATLYLNSTTHSSGDRSATFRRILRDWVEGTRDYGDRSGDTPYSSCWEEYGSEIDWTTGGALSQGNDISATSSGTMSLTATGWCTVNDAQMEADIEDFINGDLSNYGWHGRNDNQNSGKYDIFDSSDAADGVRPYLSVTYTAGGAGTIVPIIDHHYQIMGMM